jgi:hypothetical protein
MSDEAQPLSLAAPDSLRAFLAERDVPCPGCGYNLRGTQDCVCPECGGPIELAITRSAAGRGWLLLLLLALGWVTLAAGMHTTRAVISARDEARVNTGFQVLVSGGVTFRAAVGQPITINRSALTTTTLSGSAARTPITVQSPRGATAGGGTVTSGPVTITTQPAGGLSVMGRAPANASATSALAWSQVRAQTWISLGIAAVLALAAAAVLLVVLLRRRMIVQAGPSRALVTFSLTVFALYAAGQVFLFARELAG